MQSQPFNFYGQRQREWRPKKKRERERKTTDFEKGKKKIKKKKAFSFSLYLSPYNKMTRSRSYLLLLYIRRRGAKPLCRRLVWGFVAGGAGIFQVCVTATACSRVEHTDWTRWRRLLGSSRPLFSEFCWTRVNHVLLH